MVTSMHSYLKSLFGEEIEDYEQETFVLFSQEFPSRELGLENSKTDSVQVSIGGLEIDVAQSISLLKSSRAGGTTGSAVWQVTPRMAEWLMMPSNILFKSGILSSSSHVLELGAGVAGLIPISLAPRVCHFWASDQDYVLRILHSNIMENSGKLKVVDLHSRGNGRGGNFGGNKISGGPRGTTNPKERKNMKKKETGGNSKKGLIKGAGRSGRVGEPIGNIEVMELDWETDDAGRAIIARLQHHRQNSHDHDHTSESKRGAVADARDDDDSRDAGIDGIDIVIACDCIYNESLVEPFVSTCVDLCRVSFKSSDQHHDKRNFNPDVRKRDSHSFSTEIMDTGKDTDTHNNTASNKTQKQGPPSLSPQTVCIVAQQLRDELVFDAWLKAILEKFHVWQIPDQYFDQSDQVNQGGNGIGKPSLLGQGTGFVVHVALLRDI